MEQACQHIVMAAAASSAHTPPLCRCHYRNTYFIIPNTALPDELPFRDLQNET